MKSLSFSLFFVALTASFVAIAVLPNNVSASVETYPTLRGLDKRVARPKTQWKPLTTSVSEESLVAVNLLVRHCQDKDDEREATFWDVSLPDSPNVGKYKTREEVMALMAPCDRTTKALEAWLVRENIDMSTVFRSPFGDFLIFRTTVKHAKAVFGVVPKFFYDPKNPSRISVSGEAKLDQSHELAAHLISRVTLRGMVTVVEPATPAEPQQDSVDAPEFGARYPFPYWPPPPVFQGDAASAGLVAVIYSTCPDKPFSPMYPVPLSNDITLDFPAQMSDAQQPCGPAQGEITSYSFDLFPMSSAAGTRTFSGTATLGSFSCDTEPYDVPQFDATGHNVDQSQQVYLQRCFAEVPGLALPEYVPYGANITQTFTDGSKQTFTYAATHGRPLAFVNVPAKGPATLRKQYNIPPTAGATKATVNSVGVPTSALSGFYSPSDLQSFARKNNFVANSLSSQVDFVSTPQISSNLTALFTSLNYIQNEVTILNDPSQADGETSLDVQYITGLAPGATTQIWHGGFWVAADEGIWGLDNLLEVSLLVQYAEKPPTVLSLSYGWPEMVVDTEKFIDNHWMALGMQGVSVISASGDQGAFFYDPFLQDVCARFQPLYPAASPYVTAVGATQLLKTDGSSGPTEGACSIATGALITTGGGFSRGNTMPSFQTNAVKSYLHNMGGLLPPSSMFQDTNRAYPDVSLFGHSYGVYTQGQFDPTDGTSASTPSFAGMVTLLNDILLRMKQPMLGHIAPKLYAAAASHPKAFNDVVDGDNRCVGQNGPATCCEYGFAAAPGWDPVTGLGTVNLQELASAILPANWTQTGFYKSSAFITGGGGGGGGGGGISSTVIIVIAVVAAVVVIGGIVAFFVMKQRKPIQGDDAYKPMI